MDVNRKVAVIGFGNWGKNVVRVLLSIPSTEVVICDPALKNHPFPGDSRVTLSTWPEILNCSEITSVFIITPAATHYQLLKEALSSGKNVFIEKPFTLSYAQAEELNTLARDKKLILMVGYILRYNPAVRHLKEIIDRGDLGDILYFRSNRTNLGSVRTDTGVLWDLAVHDIDLVCFLTGQNPISVSMWNKTFLNHSHGDIAAVQLTFPSGAGAHIFASWLDPLKKRELVVVGNKKMALFDDTSPSEKIAVIDRNVDCIKAPNFNNFGEFQFHYRYGNILYPYIDLQEPLSNEIKHFLHCVRTHEQPQTSGEKAAFITKIMEAAERSSVNGGKSFPIDWGMKEIE